MSRIKVSSTITKIVEAFDNNSSLNNLFLSSEDGDASEFTLNYCLFDSWKLNAVQAAAFIQDILSVLDSNADKTNVSFIHAQCYKKVQVPGDTADPVRFDVLFDGNSIGKMSQFQLANITDLAPDTIQIQSPAISGTEECILSVAIGFNKA